LIIGVWIVYDDFELVVGLYFNMLGVLLVLVDLLEFLMGEEEIEYV